MVNHTLDNKIMKQILHCTACGIKSPYIDCGGLCRNTELVAVDKIIDLDLLVEVE